MASKRRKWIFGLLVMLGATILSLGIAEILLLVLGVNNDYRDSGVSVLIPRPGGPTELSECGHVPYATIRMQFPTNPRQYFNAGNSLDHKLNSVGWRDVEHSISKPAGTFRILGLGDSYLYGQGVKADDRCLDLLPSKLKSTWPETKFETINSGQPSYNTGQELQSLQRCGWRYSPDLVILHFVPNDIEPNIYTDKPKVEFFTEYSSGFLGTDWLSQHSELWALARRKIWGQIKGRAYIQQSIGSFETQPEKWDQCRGAIEGIRNECRDHDVKLLVVIFPFFIQLNGKYPFQVIHDRVNQLCAEEKIPCLDLRDKFPGYSGPELWVHPVDQHPNEIAHALAATAIAEFIIAHKEELGMP